MQRTALVVLLIVVASPAAAQSLAQRVVASDGLVQVVYPSRPSTCGDGDAFIGNVLGRSTYYSGNSHYSGSGPWSNRACVHGPALAVATVVNGEVTRLRAYVGPVPTAPANTRTVTVSSRDAAAWLGEIIARASTRVATDAMLPLVAADSVNPWPLLLHTARDENRPRDVRRAATMWLATGVTDHLGIANSSDDTDDDEMRTQAVFVLSQRPKSESVPELIDLARSAKRASVRRSAIFWLGQTGDPRAIDVYAELLGIR
jgi:hypothetical protein